MRNTLLVAAVLALFGIAANAQSKCRGRTVEKLAGEISRLFENRKLNQLDSTRPYLSTFAVRIENSLAEDGSKDQYRTQRFKTFRSAEAWLQKRDVKDEDMIYPTRESNPLISCKNGNCRYDLKGLLHNHLFLQRFTYGYKKNGCPYVKTIFIVDGD